MSTGQWRFRYPTHALTGAELAGPAAGSHGILMITAFGGPITSCGLHPDVDLVAAT